MVVTQALGGAFREGAAKDFAELPDFVTGVVPLRGLQARAVALHVAVQSPLDARVFVPFEEERGREHIVGVVDHFVREDVLHDDEVERLEGFGQAGGIRLAVEHRRTRDEEGANRIGLPGVNGVEDRGERARTFGIEDAVETLRVGERPLLTLRPLAHGDARTLEAAA